MRSNVQRQPGSLCTVKSNVWKGRLGWGLEGTWGKVPVQTVPMFGGDRYSEVQCIIGNGYMDTPYGHTDTYE